MPNSAARSIAALVLNVSAIDLSVYLPPPNGLFKSTSTRKIFGQSRAGAASMDPP